MDIETLRDFLRTLVTVASFATFVGIVLWAYSGRRRQQFEAAAALPFVEVDEVPAADSALRTARPSFPESAR